MIENHEALIENAILKSMAVQTLDLVMQSKDEELKLKVVALLEKLRSTRGKDLDIRDFMSPRFREAR